MVGEKFVSFSKIKKLIDVPYLLEVQKLSYEWFLQKDVPYDKREDQGLESVFREFFPIENPDRGIALEYLGYEIGEPKYSEDEARERDFTYSAPVKARFRLSLQNGEVVLENSVYMFDIPLMTKNATFIINGTERVIVNQLHRSPGIFFFVDEHNGSYEARIIPEKGAWIDFEVDTNGIINVRINRKRKFPAVIFLKALGFSSDEEIVRSFYEVEELSVIDNKEELIGRRVAKTYVEEDTGEIIAEVGDKIDTDILERLSFAGIISVEVIKFPSKKDDLSLIGGMRVDRVEDQDEALQKVYLYMRGEEVTPEEAKKEIERVFFNPRYYDLGRIGRYKINKKFGYKDVNTRILRVEEVVDTLKYLIGLINELEDYKVDDIDHLGNRRVRPVGELLTNQLKLGFSRMERYIRERMGIVDLDTITPQSLISTKPVISAINEFFGTGQLSQFMDQTNPLAELTHKRRLNALGPGGLTRERAGFEVRDIHFTHYGRICPIETPEGPNIGLIVSMSTYAKVNEYGFLETPYRKVVDGKVTDEVVYLTADEEENYYIAQANAPVDENGYLASNLVACRYKGNFVYKEPKEVDFMDISPQQMVSVSASLIPFLEHDDANRALMGSNMQRQAVPLLIEEDPIVGTGMEEKAARDSGYVIIAERSGVVTYVSADMIVIRPDEQKDDRDYDVYRLIKFRRSNQATTINQKPIVRVGDKVKSGDVIADGPAIKNGRLALGKNILVAIMPWRGYNYEDAIVVSERIAKDDVFTSVHIEEFEVETRETKLGKEVITRDIPNVPERALRNLDENGIVRIGAWVKPDDILVGKVTPKGETDLTPEYRLLHSIFGEKIKDVKDTSLRLPNGYEGVVIDIKRFSRENGDDLPPGVEELIKVYIAKKRKLIVGDKLAGRHGNKGVVSVVLPEEDMPFLPDGTPVDMILNPLGVPSRMNLGQIFETYLGWAGEKLGIKFISPVFDGAKEEDIKEYLKKAGLPEDCKVMLRDGRTGEEFEYPVVVGYMYMMKLNHMVEDKVHARSTGPYSLIIQQPLGGKAQFGGQRLGEMEVWALEAYGAAHTLQEFLTVKSDDIVGRTRIYEAIVKGENVINPGVPESFNVLINELRGLCLDVTVYDKKGKPIDLTEWRDYSDYFTMYKMGR